MLPYVTDQLGGSTDNTGRFKGINRQVQNWYASPLELLSPQPFGPKAPYMRDESAILQEPCGFN
jgi:hypothetical protein